MIPPIPTVLSFSPSARRWRGAWKLEPGDSVGFPAGPGNCHTFLNNTEQEVRLLVVGEANKKFNRIYYPLNPGYAATRQDRWVDHPPQFFGPHDGKPRKK